jgi:hypothetical protein
VLCIESFQNDEVWVVAESSADKKDGSLMDIMELLQGDSSLPTAWSTDADTLMDDRRLGIHARPAYTAGIPTRGQYNSVRYWFFCSSLPYFMSIYEDGISLLLSLALAAVCTYIHLMKTQIKVCWINRQQDTSYCHLSSIHLQQVEKLIWNLLTYSIKSKKHTGNYKTWIR